MTKYSHQNAVDLFVRMVQVDSPSFSESAMVDFIENEVKTLGWGLQDFAPTHKYARPRR